MVMTEEEYNQASPLALALYESFFNELMTGVRNSINNFKGAQWHQFNKPDFVNAVSYYKGKEDAFREIAERIEKEHYMTGHHIKWVDPKTNDFCVTRDKDIERMIPFDEKMHKYGGMSYCMRYRRALAELLEKYMREGFMMGRRFAQKEVEDEIPKFNPVEFSDECIEAFVHPYFKDFNEQ